MTTNLEYSLMELREYETILTEPPDGTVARRLMSVEDDDAIHDPHCFICRSDLYRKPEWDYALNVHVPSIPREVSRPYPWMP